MAPGWHLTPTQWNQEVAATEDRHLASLPLGTHKLALFIGASPSTLCDTSVLGQRERWAFGVIPCHVAPIYGISTKDFGAPVAPPHRFYRDTQRVLRSETDCLEHPPSWTFVAETSVVLCYSEGALVEAGSA